MKQCTNKNTGGPSPGEQNRQKTGANSAQKEKMELKKAEGKAANTGTHETDENPQKDGTRTGSAATFRADPVETLEQLEEETYKAFDVESKPRGNKWLYMVLDLSRRILDEKGLLEAITPADLDALTDENFHTARHAAEIVLHLKQFTI